MQKEIPEIFLKPYNPQAHEDYIYELWNTANLFNPDTLVQQGFVARDAEPFSIVLPPPNVTGVLHMGHASMLAIEDTIVRFKRMCGMRVLWIPGTDHAAIATQEKVEKMLSKKGIRKNDLTREDFLKQVDDFAKQSQETILTQVRKLGSSVDWSRLAFTLDETREKAVKKAFRRMYTDDLIYRGDRIVNWDPKLQTNVSDDEVEYKDAISKFYYLTYGPFTVGTARPETKFGDQYVVMHPDDTRYASYNHGDTLELEWINGPMTATIIKDTAIDMEFGSGVMTITPWHDHTDFEIAERHNLLKEQIIDFYGKLLPIAGEFSGMKITEAREKIIEKLQKKGLVAKVDENYAHRIATNPRGGGIIEPQIKKQWFIDVNKSFVLPNSKIDGIASGATTTLKEIMQKAVSDKQITILPERFEKIYFHWIDNLRDWCISRQIWYGHRVPVWYKGDDMHVGEHPGGDGWEQDTDTLDTWFSSGLWTFSTLGWPDMTDDLKTYHPTTLLETGYDILFFWVARMILMSGYLLGDIPFKTVYLHGLVRDVEGRKMSKSLGNIIDPLDMSAKYGADATRLSLIVGNGPGNDTKLSEGKIQAYKKYANKIWNATRFVLEATDTLFDSSDTPLTEYDKEILHDWHALLSEVTDDITDYRLYLAAEKLYHYFWHTFADLIIEESKPILAGTDIATCASRKILLSTVLLEQLKALHPFMPFVTEAIWQHLPSHKNKRPFLMVEKWPSKT